MPAKSKAQQAMMAAACHGKPTKAKGIPKESACEYARTKRKGLPQKVSKPKKKR